LKVTKTPVATFAFSPVSSGVPIDITFVNTSQHASKFRWLMNDADWSNKVQPSNSFEIPGQYVVKLIAESPSGCVDSVAQTLTLLPSVSGIEILEVKIVKENGLEEIVVTFVNKGSYPQTAINFTLVKNDKTSLTEKWTGVVYPGEIHDFTFSGKYKTSPEHPVEYLCVKAHVLNNVDSVMCQHQKCISTIADFKVFSISPVPCNTQATLVFSIPTKNDITIQVVNSVGLKVWSNTATYNSGFNAVQLPTSSLSNGMYLVHITYNNETQSFKIIVDHSNKK
jgi:PKD repeat protein